MTFHKEPNTHTHSGYFERILVILLVRCYIPNKIFAFFERTPKKYITSTKLNRVNNSSSLHCKHCTFCFAQEFLMPCNSMFLSKWRSLTNANVEASKPNKATEAKWMGWVRNQSLICDLYFPIMNCASCLSAWEIGIAHFAYTFRYSADNIRNHHNASSKS